MPDLRKFYTNHGSVTGWDPKCDQTPEWIAQMRVHLLERKAAQPFYNVLSSDGSERYVAEDNILPFGTNGAAALEALTSLDIIGKFFKSHDGERFILSSDLAEMYPDDT